MLSRSPPEESSPFGGSSRTNVFPFTPAPHIRSAYYSHDCCIDSSQFTDFCSSYSADFCPSYFADNCLHADPFFINSSIEFCVNNCVVPNAAAEPNGLCNFCHDSNHMYLYMPDLLWLEACRAAMAPPLPQSVTAIATPLRLAAWEEALHTQAFASYIIQGIKHGFHIGFDGGLCTPIGSVTNMRSAEQNHASVDDYLTAELAAGASR